MPKSPEELAHQEWLGYEKSLETQRLANSCEGSFDAFTEKHDHISENHRIYRA